MTPLVPSATAILGPLGRRESLTRTKRAEYHCVRLSTSSGRRQSADGSTGADDAAMRSRSLYVRSSTYFSATLTSTDVKLL